MNLHGISAINKITQTSGSIAICTAAVGGHPDNDGNDLNPFQLLVPIPMTKIL
jgi:hypothetical protein